MKIIIFYFSLLISLLVLLSVFSISLIKKLNLFINNYQGCSSSSNNETNNSNHDKKQQQ